MISKCVVEITPDTILIINFTLHASVLTLIRALISKIVLLNKMLGTVCKIYVAFVSGYKLPTIQLIELQLEKKIGIDRIVTLYEKVNNRT